MLEGIRAIASEDLPRMKARDVHDLVKATEARNFVLIMQLYNVSALERRESRLVHYREDYPYTDDRHWRKWINLRNNGKDGISVRIEHVPLGCANIIPDSLSKKPVPVAYKIKTL